MFAIRGVSMKLFATRHTLCIALFFLTASFAAAQTYAVADLGPGGGSGGGRAINDLGAVAIDNGGISYVWTPSHHYLALTPLPGGTETTALGINSHGFVVGESYFSVGYHAVLWSNGEPKDLGTLPGGVLSWANAINAAGVVVGASDGTDVGPEATVWSSSGVQGLGFLSGGDYSAATGINRVGQVVGFSYVAKGGGYAFIWSKATGMQELGSLPGGGGSSANGINDLGQIAGGSSCGGSCTHAVLWSAAKGSIQDLGVLPGASFSSAYAINNQGMVVGSSGYIDSADHAFVWTSSGGMQDLNDLIPQSTGWILEFAFAINDSGQIAGFGVINGQERAFLLTPQ
jgi:probable HAF family extracellular repeat protein